MPRTKAEIDEKRPLDPDDPVQRLPGIGPRMSEKLAESGVFTLWDLIRHVPRRYQDRSRVMFLGSIDGARPAVLVHCRVRQAKIFRSRSRGKVIGAVLEDATGTLPAIWFNRRWKDPRLEEGAELYLFGPVQELKGGVLKLVNPDLETAETFAGGGVRPVDAPLGPLSGRRLRRFIDECLPALDQVDEPLDAELRQRFGIEPLAGALRALHRPELDVSASAVEEYVEALNEGRSPHHRSLMVYEAIGIFCHVAARREQRRRLQAPQCLVDDALRRRAAALLPFRLTRAQRRVVAEIVADLGKPEPMARLLQGDVGSGKTAVAALALLVCAASGHQAALMAPTELLAEQHHRSLSVMLGRAREAIGLLTASQSKAEQRSVRSGLADGSLRLVVGTHALFQKSLRFARLGLVVIDEQHRFGVQDRRRLIAKGRAPHVLVMTATPIPRSLALTVHGDLEVSVIDELPPGRQAVRTVLRPRSARPRVLEFIQEEVSQGGRAYVVCPQIEGADLAEVAAVEATAAELAGALEGCAVGTLHGRMGRDERDAVQQAFRAGEIQVLVATSVVEVGVDVPEATVMVVESPERFGLAQLHQLRGRVGRGERKSYCVLLVAEDLAEASRTRLEHFSSCQDGFEIAEADLRMRGPGEISGDRQWGVQGARFLHLLKHHEVLATARSLVDEVTRRNGIRELEAHVKVFTEGPGPKGSV